MFISRMKSVHPRPTLIALSLALQALTSFAANPITVTLDSGSSTTTFTAGNIGSANYVVTGPAVPGTLNLIVNPGSSGNLTATQIQNGGASLCTGGQPVCAPGTFSLTGPSANCCLQFRLSSTTAGSYMLAPSVSTAPATYTGQAASTTVTVNPLPPTTTITVPTNFTIAYTNAGDQTASGSLTVTNTGGTAATNVQVTNLSDLTCNSGTVSQTPCTAQVNGACDITFTATQPTTCLASSVMVAGTNTPPVNSAVAFKIAGYYVFALSNSPSSNQPQVVDTSDLGQIQWGNAVQTDANSLTNGFTDTNTIVNTVSIGTNAAVACYNSTSGGASVGTWYLPAICQMGGSEQGAGCSNNNNTTLDGLVQLGFIPLDDIYWSSTENADFPQDFAWFQFFNTEVQSPDYKFHSYRVRCVRALNP